MSAPVACAVALMVWALLRDVGDWRLGDNALDALVGLGFACAALSGAPGHAVWVLMAGILRLWLDAGRGPPVA